ncbi:hypothetical protein CB1_000884048 [Camelus ferus]|nr:hypothetical protein CB1_000884048 [Camelus ferus]
MTQDGPLFAVQEALRKCFPVVEEQQGLWQSTLRDCPPLLTSLSNLAEQLQAAQNLRFEDVPSLRAFPDLKERLKRKQLAAGDIVLDKLWERLDALLKVRDVVSSHVERVLQIYEQHADALGVDAVLQASATSPSVAEMLEWLQDIERHYRNSSSYQLESLLSSKGDEFILSFTELYLSCHLESCFSVSGFFLTTVRSQMAVAVFPPFTPQPGATCVKRGSVKICSAGESCPPGRYLKRKYLLSSIEWGDLGNIRALPTAWDRISEDEHPDLVRDILLNVSFFLEE